MLQTMFHDIFFLSCINILKYGQFFPKPLVFHIKDFLENFQTDFIKNFLNDIFEIGLTFSFDILVSGYFKTFDRIESVSQSRGVQKSVLKMCDFWQFCKKKIYFTFRSSCSSHCSSSILNCLCSVSSFSYYNRLDYLL